MTYFIIALVALLVGGSGGYLCFRYVLTSIYKHKLDEARRNQGEKAFRSQGEVLEQKGRT